MQKKLVLLTGYNHFFGQSRKPWISVDIEKIRKTVLNRGFDIIEYSFDQIANSPTVLNDNIVFYTFSQKENLRLYLKSVVHFLYISGNVIVPKYELLLCHENKGYQELYKKMLGLSNLNSYYFSSIKEISNINIKYPMVLKMVYGSNGKGVFLVHNRLELEKYLRKQRPKLSILEKMDLFRRRYLRFYKKIHHYPDFSPHGDYLYYREYLKPEIRYVLQEFVPNLKYDYRVIVLWDKYYVVKRLNRDNDFRASGAKRFVVMKEIPNELLNYSKYIFDKFDTPFLSLDIGEAKGMFFLFEYQALHFGINCIVLSEGYYKYHNKWVFIKEKPDFEISMADGLISYLETKFDFK